MFPNLVKNFIVTSCDRLTSSPPKDLFFTCLELFLLYFSLEFNNKYVALF